MKKDGSLFLGKEFSLEKNKLLDSKYVYDPADLTTHGVVFGMTGSGKTGLCIDFLEEAIAEDIPIVIIDPKGDVANLALLFPDLAPHQFKPWISPVEAQKEGMSLDEYSNKVAENWKKGLAGWDIGQDQVAALKQKMDLRIFTPGSSAGLPVSIIEGFKHPGGNFEDNEEDLLEKIRNSVSALLSLLDIDSDPLKSQPHILISNIIQHFWRLGKDVSLEELILNIQKPPFKKLGVFDINRLIEEKDRIELAFKINNVISAPSFRYWSSGMPIDASLLYKKSGSRTPVNIFYIAHLSENERMFFVSLLLNEIVYWIRRQQGSTDLKYILYMDEIVGYLPPYPKNPPSKPPMMLLLKQARAFGMGVMLVTQNPKDIDYKALSNMGTWFIGKLQTELDRERVLEGLRGAMDASGEAMTIQELAQTMSGLQKRTFLVKNVHEKDIKVFQTRWAMSYLAGPLTRDQLKGLSAEVQLEGRIAEKMAEAASEASSTTVASDFLPTVPRADMAIEYLYDSIPAGSENYYSPYHYLEGEVVFDDTALSLYIRNKFQAWFPAVETPDPAEAEMSKGEIEYSRDADTIVQGFEPLPPNVNFTSIRRIQQAFKNHLFSTLSLNLFKNSELKLVSEAEESEDAFRHRCREVVEKTIEKEVEKLKNSYERKIDRLEDQVEREKIKTTRIEKEVSSKKTEELLSLGESVLGLFLGSRSTRGLSSAARRRRTTSSASNQLDLQKTKVSQLEEDLLALQEELEDKVADIEDTFYEKADNVELFEVRLEKDDILVSKQAILWKLKK